MLWTELWDVTHVYVFSSVALILHPRIAPVLYAEQFAGYRFGALSTMHLQKPGDQPVIGGAAAATVEDRWPLCTAVQCH
jgi:hypothetical protein